MKILVLLLSSFFLLVPAWTDRAQAAESANRGLPLGSKIKKRVALVMGNGGYYHARHLKNPANDARAVARVLGKLGFTVISGQDLTKLEMERAIGRFGRAFKKGGVGLVYYSGHGIQVNGRNFLIPVDALLEYLEDIDLEAVDLDLILSRLRRAQSRLNIIVLDACRNNPFGPDSRSWTTKGLAPIQAPMGTLISFSTAAGETAADGEGDYSPYTASFLSHIQTPGLKVEDVFKRIREEVYLRTDKKQLAWVSSSVMGDFYLAPRATEAKPPAPAPKPKPKPKPVAVAKPALGQVEVTSNIDGAEFELAGRRHSTKREQALVIGQIMPGQHQVKATKDGFQDWQGRVTITPHKTATLRIEMNPKKDLHKTFTNSIGMRFVLIPAGSFMMGSPEGQGDDDEHPQHLVKITRPFYLQTYEVSIKEYLKYINQTKDIKGIRLKYPYSIKKKGNTYRIENVVPTYRDNFRGPISNIGWKAAGRFCDWLNNIEKTKNYRLPTEAEWEYACRAGSTTMWSFGDDWSDLKKHTPYKKPNKFGLYGMHRGVGELCTDWYQPGYYSISPVKDPQGPNDGKYHVVRGGSNYGDMYNSRSANRATGASHVGFRVLREP